MMSQPLFQNTVNLTGPGVTIFAGIIKLVTFFIKKVLEDSRKAKIFKNFVPKCNLYMYFLI